MEKEKKKTDAGDVPSCCNYIMGSSFLNIPQLGKPEKHDTTLCT